MSKPLPISSKTTFIYVACADDSSIDCYQLDTKLGQLHYLRSTNTFAQVMPLAIAPDKKNLYAAIRSEPYKLMSYQIEQSSGELIKLAEASLPSSMAYISTDRQGKFLLSASYHDSQIFITPLSHGYVVGAAKSYATGLHAHFIVAHPFKAFVYATSLGSDLLHQYSLNTQNGQLVDIDKGYIHTPKGVGPRHIVISPDGLFLYVVTEMSATILCYRIDPHGALIFFAEIMGFPNQSYGLKKSKVREQVTLEEMASSTWASDIKLTPCGKFLYIAERTSSTVSAFRVNKENGLLQYIETLVVERQPRSIAIDPSGHYMVVTGQLDNKIGLYQINQQTGRLINTASAKVSKNANWVEIISC